MVPNPTETPQTSHFFYFPLCLARRSVAAFITANINTKRVVVNGCDATMVSVTMKPGDPSIATCVDDATRLAKFSVWGVEINQPLSINVVPLVSEDKKELPFQTEAHLGPYEKPRGTGQLNAAAALQIEKTSAIVPVARLKEHKC